MLTTRISLLMVLLLQAATVWPASFDPPAFPGARGFGAGSLGGRGGDVYIVTTLENAGEGSLREAIATAVGPRTVVFRVGGTIDLDSALEIGVSRITIAGQTAPGGIGVKGYPVRVRGVSDVIIRFMRFRTGDINAVGMPDGDLAGDAADSLSIVESSNVMIDHVSASWSMDETLSVTDSSNVTVQHSIISESLNDSFHSEGLHGFGTLARGVDDGGYTFWGNLWSHHLRRSPGTSRNNEAPSDEAPPRSNFEIINNVIYDWGTLPSHTTSTFGQLRINLLGNVYIAGPSTTPCPFCVFVHVAQSIDDEVLLFQRRNRIDFIPDGVFFPLVAGELSFPIVDPSGVPRGFIPLADQPFSFESRTIWVVPPLISYAKVLRRAGASIARDEVDKRIVRQVIEQTGGIIDSQQDVGGWPDDPPAAGDIVDSDSDGMPDRWECRNRLNRWDSGDRNEHDLSRRFTNLEVYLHQRSVSRWYSRYGTSRRGC